MHRHAHELDRSPAADRGRRSPGSRVARLLTAVLVTTASALAAFSAGTARADDGAALAQQRLAAVAQVAQAIDPTVVAPVSALLAPSLAAPASTFCDDLHDEIVKLVLLQTQESGDIRHLNDILTVIAQNMAKNGEHVVDRTAMKVAINAAIENRDALEPKGPPHPDHEYNVANPKQIAALKGRLGPTESVIANLEGSIESQQSAVGIIQGQITKLEISLAIHEAEFLVLKATQLLFC